MKNLLLTPLFLLLCAATWAQVSTSEKQALVDLYIATDGDAWTNTWELNDPVATWHGVTVTNNKVTGLSLLFNNMVGELPESIVNLSNLKTLELSFNKISGELPSELGQLEQLELIAFNGNNLTGSIPASIGDLEQLTALHLSSNNLSGELPESLGDLDNLKILNVFDNYLEGTLPVDLAMNSNLEKLVIAQNNIEQTEDYAGFLLFEGEGASQFKKPTIVTPAGKTVIAIETSDDEN